MLIAIIESCFEFLHPQTVRMLVNTCALVVAKIVNDERLYIVDAAEVLEVDIAQLRAAEHFVFSVLLRTSHPSGLRIAPTKYARALLSSYETYSPACDAIMREIGATHIAGCWRRTLAVQLAYRKAALATAQSPVCIMSGPGRASPVAKKAAPSAMDSMDAQRRPTASPWMRSKLSKNPLLGFDELGIRPQPVVAASR